MTIPESQLQTWSNPGSTIAAQTTHTSIRNAIDASWRLEGKNFDIFLQGSYRNATNVRGDSDVDLVVQLDSTFMPNVAALPQDQLKLYQRDHSDATYDWATFRSDVLQTLSSYYGAHAVQEGRKAIKVAATSNRLAADVVVALQYRRYKSYRGMSTQDYDSGIWFKNLGTGRDVVNYPIQHYDNGVAKNGSARTGERFKPVVRMFKNARGCLVEDGKLGADIAPSYYIQCLLYNVPDNQYSGTFQQMYRNVANWLLTAQLDSFMCQNGIVSLFGPAPEQWDIDKARTLIRALIALWNGW